MTDEVNSSMRSATLDYVETWASIAEAYFPYIAYLCVIVFYYYVRRSVLFKIHAANIEASNFCR